MERRVSTMEANVGALKENMSKLDAKVDAGFLATNAKIDVVVTKLDTFHADADQRFVSQNQFDRRVSDLETAWINKHDEILMQLGKRWINNTLAAILGSILTGMIGALWFFITRK